jgi:hypothetical protein
LRNKFPVFGAFIFAFKLLFLDQLRKGVTLLLAPVVGGKVYLFEAEPLKHA